MSTKPPASFLKRPVQLLRYIQLFRNWPQVLMVRFKCKTSADFTYVFRDQRRLVSPYADGPYIVSEVIVNEAYYPFRKYYDSNIIFDIGANVGTFVIWAKQYFPNASYYSFEPAPDLFNVLEHNRLINPDVDWTVLSYGVGSHAANVVASRPPDLPGSTSAFETYSGGTQMNLEIRGINEIWTTLGKPPVDLMKIDCEGNEYDVIDCINQDLLNNVKCICMELHPTQTERRTNLIRRLIESGFTVTVGVGALADLHATRLGNQRCS